MTTATSTPDARRDAPRARGDANALSRACFAWVTPFLRRGLDAHAGRAARLEMGDLLRPPEAYVARRNADGFERAMLETLGRVERERAAAAAAADADADADATTRKEAKAKAKEGFLPALASPLWRTFGGVILQGTFFKLCNDVVQFLPPVVLSGFLRYVGNKPNFMSDAFGASVTGNGIGWLYCALMFSLAVLRTLCEQTYFYYAQASGICIKGALSTAVYRKTMRLSSAGRSGSTTGEVLNYMQLDAQRVGDLMLFLNVLWSGLLQTMGYMALLYSYIGWSVFGGLFIMLGLIPAQKIFYGLMYRYRKKQNVETDRRVKLENEGLSGIKILKLNAWEESLREEVAEVRKREMIQATKVANVAAINTSIMSAGPVIVSVVVFSLYAGVMERPMDADIVFPALTLFNLLRFPILFYPRCLAQCADAVSSLQRLQKYFMLPEASATTKTVEFERKDDFDQVVETTKVGKKGDVLARMTRGTFSWSDPDVEVKENEAEKVSDAKKDEIVDKVNPTVPFLRDINFELRRGELTIVVGAVGAGKTALISALLGEMSARDGASVTIDATVSYVAQTAWVQSMSLRDNVLFGKRYDEEKYHQALEAACMEADINLLPNGDDTEIGEKGITLSGGQKQRTAIARAVYADAEIAILDDPLSALDAHVAKDVFKRCIRGVLRSSAVLLVTHQLQFTEFADNILVMKDGEVVESGKYSELMDKGPVFQQMMRSYRGTQKAETTKEEVVDTSVSKDMKQTMSLQKDKAKQNIEKREEGSVKMNVYKAYINAMGGRFWTFSFLMFITIAERALSVFTNVWLAYWSQQKWNLGQTVYLGGYSAIGIVSAFIAWIRTFAWVVAALTAATGLHLKLLQSVMDTRMSFFDTTPLGRVIQRFSKDTNALDNIIGQSVSSVMSFGLLLFGTIVVMGWIMPILLPFMVPIFAVYFYIQMYYRPGYREAKRLDAISGSPVFAHFGETLGGLSTIRAFGHQRRFITENEQRIGANQIADYTQKCCCERWLPVRLETIGNSLTLVVACVAVYSRDSLDAALIGLAVTYAIDITGVLSWVIRIVSELESQMVSVERIDEYTRLPSEEETGAMAAHGVVEEPPPEWPSQGGLRFEKLQMRYRSELPLVLNGISFEVQPGHKVGICGRTGSGKSSLLVALWRLCEPTAGSIWLDGIDISTISLKRLRSSITCIPQDPVLFSGTIRYNLDPFNEYTDEKLWYVLEHVKCKDFIGKQGLGLDAPVEEFGGNYSAGQRQMLCLARAMLRDTKVVCLDEATASVDTETDDNMQKVIATEFVNCTILTIAHRINTIIENHQVVCLQAGNLVAMDSPSAMLADPNSIFSQLVAETGEASAKNLKQRADAAEAARARNTRDIERTHLDSHIC
jgi:ABC-type multidrug transport system fused ATPase/permease subunit